MTGLLKNIGLVFLISLSLFLLCSDSIFDPPYWDVLTGVFHQAIWLKDNHFDYYALAYDHGPYETGGPRVYFYSIYPALIALAYKLFDMPQQVFVLFHILNLICSSISILVFYKLISFSSSQFEKIIITSVFALYPLFLAQTYGLAMEMPVLMFALLSFYFYLKQKEYLTSLFLILASLIKLNIAPLAFAFVFLFVLLRLDKSNVPKLFALLSPCFLFAGFVYLENIAFSSFSYSEAFQSENLINLKRIINRFALTMYLLPLVGAAYLIMISILVFKLFKFIPKISFEDFRQKINKHQDFLIPIFISLVFFSAIVVFRYFLPKYLLITVPFLFLSLFLLLKTFYAKLYKLILLLFLIVCIFNHSGNLYKYFPLSAEQENSGHSLERSLAYRKQIQSDQVLVNNISKSYQGYNIYTFWPYVHMFTNQDYGYLKTNPTNVISLAMPNIVNSSKVENKEKNIILLIENEFSRRLSLKECKEKQLEEVALYTTGSDINKTVSFKYCRQLVDLLKTIS